MLARLMGSLEDLSTPVSSIGNRLLDDLTRIPGDDGLMIAAEHQHQRRSSS